MLPLFQSMPDSMLVLFPYSWQVQAEQLRLKHVQYLFSFTTGCHWQVTPRFSFLHTIHALLHTCNTLLLYNLKRLSHPKQAGRGHSKPVITASSLSMLLPLGGPRCLSGGSVLFPSKLFPVWPGILHGTLPSLEPRAPSTTG